MRGRGGMNAGSFGTGRGMTRGRGGGRGAPRGGTGQRFNPMMSKQNGGAAEGHVLFAYNIGPMTGEDDVRQLFEMYGKVTKVNVMWDFAKNQGKGYAFVTMPSQEEASAAIQQLNGYNYSGKPLQVSFKKSS